MYRIVMSRSGSYYVQSQTRYGWSKCSPFFTTRGAARSFVSNNLTPAPRPRVVEYIY